MIAESRKPIRVAQVLAGMAPGGIETWLVRVLRHIDRQRFQIDFITHPDGPCFYDEEVLLLGSRIIRCPSAKRAWAYGRALSRTFRREGGYDVVHSHLHHYSGFVLRIAARAGVPVRIAHCHSDTSAAQAGAGFLRRLYLNRTKRWIDRYATLGLSVSPAAGAALFSTWNVDPRWRVLYCGIETDAFHATVDKQAFRRNLGLPPDALVIGHVGTFREPKNHVFLVEVAAAVMAREPRAHLLLVSDGPLRPAIESKVRQLGIADRTVFAGQVASTVSFLRGAMDVFVFPSLWEGLPLSVVEAQAAGLPCVISDVVTPDVIVAKAMVERLRLTAPVEQWAQAVLRLLTQTPEAVCRAALIEVESSRFNLQSCVRTLEEIYAQR
ncbi:MAG: glycosyltransferase family 1 protein [Rhodopirellula sp.]|nr:glycosyltransferase family 1 protein [Rhodopirellula sp.]